MKHKNKIKKLEEKQKAFLSNRIIQDANSEHPGSFHKLGSLKK